jgi:membrane fusion protein (multidrug efflux system)
VHLKKHVQAGDVLVELDASSERLALAEEQTRLAAIPPQLSALERQIADEQQAGTNAQAASASALERSRADHREALAAAQFAEEHARRFERMSPAGRVSEIEALRARAEATKTRAAAEALAAEVARLTAEENSKAATRRAAVNSLEREAAALNGQREVALASVARLRQEIEKHLIRAPSSGEIGAAAPLDVGAFVAAGEVVARIVPSDRLRVIADFEPAHVLGRVSKGQVARMRLDGFPWAQFGTIALTVDRVASEIRDGRIRVELLPDASARSKLLQHGLPGSVEIEIERTTPLVMALRAAGQMLVSPAQPVSPTPSTGS